MFTFKVDKNNIKMIESETVTSGSVNVYDCQFIFSEEWEGLSKTVAFKAGDVAVASILNDDNTCKIPWEVLKTDGADLFVGIKGAAGTETAETDDDVILPTVWAYIGIIRKGATDGTDPLPPSPSVYEQILIEIRKLEDGKQNKLTAGEGVEISADNVISCTVAPYDDSEIRGKITAQGEAINANSRAIADNSEAISRLNDDINTKQSRLTAGEGIEISADNVISSTVKPYDDSSIRGELTTQGEAIRAQGATINTQGATINAQGEAINANSEAIAGNTEAINRLNNDINTKQNKITGTKGQIVGFDDNGEPVAQDGGAGTPGKDGVTFTPAVSESGVISWTNDGGKENPDPVNIKGIPGTPGTPGTPGEDGVTFTPTVSAEGVISWSNNGGLANPEPVNIRGIPGTPGTPGTPGANGVTFTPTVSSEGVISWNNDGGLSNPEPVNIKGTPGTPGANGVTFTPTVSSEGVISWSNDGGRENPEPVNIKGTPGAPGTPGTPGSPGTPGAPGKNGVTFTPTVSSDGVISWTNDGGLNSPDPVNIKGPAGTYTAGAGININNDTISFSDTASTKKLATGSLTSFGGVTVTSVNGFTLNRQTSNLSLISEYIHTDATSYTEFKTYYGYLEAYITPDADKTLSTTIPLYLNMSHSISFPGAVGFAIIKVSTMSRYIAMAESSGGIIRLYPTESVSVTSGKNITVYLYLR